MKAFIFPGQGCQKKGMGKLLYSNFPKAKEIFERGNDFLGRKITDVIFDGPELELMETINTQPAIFLYEVALASCQDVIVPDFVGGHSLGEFAALVINGTISFEDGLNLVLNRAIIAQKVCERYDTAMGAIVGLDDDHVVRRVGEIREETSEPLYVANFNGPGQIVITGSKKGIRFACKAFKQEGAKRAVLLAISGSFHSPYMEDARVELSAIINKTRFNTPVIPVFQCVDGKPHVDPFEIKSNLIEHITHPVLWTTMINNMLNNQVSSFYEVGTDDTLQKIVRRITAGSDVVSLWDLDIYGEIKGREYSINIK